MTVEVLPSPKVRVTNWVIMGRLCGATGRPPGAFRHLTLFRLRSPEQPVAEVGAIDILYREDGACRLCPSVRLQPR